jgi:DNA helicase HerA-like ATPase
MFLGKTGSGKSFLARYLLKLAYARGWRIEIVDPKKDWMIRLQADGSRKLIPFGKKPGTVDSPVLVSSFNRELHCQIIQPVQWDKTMDRFADDIMKVKNTIIYFDEVTQLASANSVPLKMRILFTQGRSKNVGAWSGSQRPVRIPEDVKGQAEVWFIFKLTSQKDR